MTRHGVKATSRSHVSRYQEPVIAVRESVQVFKSLLLVELGMKGKRFQILIKNISVKLQLCD